MDLKAFLDVAHQQMGTHGFAYGLAAAAFILAGFPVILQWMTKGCLSFTAWAIPPIVAGIARVMALVLAHPLIRTLVQQNKPALIKLIDAADAALSAILLAIHETVEKAIQESDTIAAPPQAPRPPDA